MKSHWTEIRDEIRRRVLERELLPGDKLPSDQELAKEFGCARTTVQRAMLELAQSGTVRRRRKGGTTITLHPITRATLDIPITRLEIEATGKTPGYTLISQDIKQTPEPVTKAFRLSQPVDMLHVKALHLADGAPYIFEDRWVCHTTTPEILDVDLSIESANEWLIRNRPYSDCDIRFLAQKATADEARLLQTNPDDALFVIERTTWVNSLPITMVRAVGKPGYHISTRSGG